jgi:hypothetical protein
MAGRESQHLLSAAVTHDSEPTLQADVKYKEKVWHVRLDVDAVVTLTRGNAVVSLPLAEVSTHQNTTKHDNIHRGAYPTPSAGSGRQLIECGTV